MHNYIKFTVKATSITTENTLKLQEIKIMLANNSK